MNELTLKMKEWWLKGKEKWFGLTLREKQAVALGGSLLGIMIVYYGLWSPLANAAVAMRSRIQTERKTLAWMQTANRQIQKMAGHSNNQTKATSPVVLLSALQKQVHQAGLAQYLTQLKQVTNDTIAMHFQKVSFDKVIGLLTTISKEQRVSITQMSVIAETTPGVVNAEVMIKLG